MTSPRAALIAALTLGALSVVGVPVSQRASSTAVSDLVSGVWWAGQADGTPAGPPPAQVPAGGLWVSSTVAGTIAESAVRFTVGANDRQPILSLPVAMLTTLPKTAAPVDVDLHILACAATGSWTPPPVGTFGALSAAPAYDCNQGQVLGALSADAKQVVFELAQFISDANRVVNVVVIPKQIPAPIPASPVALPVALPVPIPTVLLSPTFDVTFNPVTAANVEVLTTTPVTGDDGGFDDTIDSSYGTGALDFALGTPATPRPQRGFAALPGRVARQLGAVKADARSAERTTAALVFVLLCAWAWLVNRDPVPGAAAGRPFRSLYDGAPAISAEPKRGFGTMLRVGKPPPLR